jgi:protein SCO1
MSRTQSIALATVVAIVAVAAGVLISRALPPRGSGPALVAGTLLAPPRPLPAFQLIDHDNRPFGPERLSGRWTFVFFGFTSCPDVCPVTLSALAQTRKMLEDMPDGLRPQVVLVSVDPQRDTAERLAAYVKAFDPSFIGVTASQPAVEELARQMGAAVAVSPGEGDQYRVDHSSSVFLIDPNGAMRALFSTAEPKLISQDYRRIAAPAGA